MSHLLQLVIELGPLTLLLEIEEIEETNKNKIL